MYLSKCLKCSNYDLSEGMATGKCKAFPEGIPMQIFENIFDHTNPYPGDNGIRFTPISD